MLDIIRNIGDQIMGRGDASITVPTFDGALKPNKLLDEAEVVANCTNPVDLVCDGETLLFADGPVLMRLGQKGAKEIRRFDRPITALALMEDAVAVALESKEVQVFDSAEAPAPLITYHGHGIHAITALCADGHGGLYATDGSAKQSAKDWVWDLMERGQTGRLLHLTAGGEVTVAANKLRYAYGAAMDGSDVLVSEPWAHRLMRIGAKGSAVALGRLPVYPSRLSPATGGGWWLTAFTARTQLVEFVLREPTFRKRMMAELHPDHWIAPRLRTGQSVMEPMQGAHLKTMGVTKPWAPPRSYGLIVRLDADARPIASAHSRVDGTVHGITACAEMSDHLYFIAAGPRQLLRIPLAQFQEAAQ